VRQAAELAHRLRPSIRLLGIVGCLDVLDEIYALGSRGEGRARIPGLVAVASLLLEHVLDELKKGLP
jgi:hypothetical protein